MGASVILPGRSETSGLLPGKFRGQPHSREGQGRAGRDGGSCSWLDKWEPGAFPDARVQVRYGLHHLWLGRQRAPNMLLHQGPL